MGYRLSRKAAADLRAIYAEGIRLFGLQQADRHMDRLEQAFELVGGNPHMARERFELSPPARVHPVKSHVVLYVVRDDGDVLIVRVRHSREDWTGFS